MNILKKFTDQKMSWGKVIVMALASAVLTAVLKLLPFLNGTSFQDIAVNPECWLLFAVFITVNCEKWYEAALKTFVFFLISQPLIYLIQVPFSSEGFGIFRHYGYWFRITLLTLPGAVAAFQLRRRNLLSAAVLAVAVGFLGYMVVYYFRSVSSDFPHHLLSMCFCAALAVFFIFVLLDRKAHRAAVCAVLVAVIAVSLILFRPQSSEMIQLGEGTWTYTAEDPSVVNISINDDGSAVVKGGKKGSTLVTFVSDAGTALEYYVTVSGGGVYINTFD